MKGRGWNRRQLFAAAGIGCLPTVARGGEATAAKETPVADLPRVADLARNALAAWPSAVAGFERAGEGARLDLGPAGLLRVEKSGTAAVRVTLTRGEVELEILRPLASSGVGRVVARLATDSGGQGPRYDTLRRVPGGFEMTFSSDLALRHAEARFVPARLPEVYGRLADRAVEGARSLLG